MAFSGRIAALTCCGAKDVNVNDDGDVVIFATGVGILNVIAVVATALELSTEVAVSVAVLLSTYCSGVTVTVFPFCFKLASLGSLITHLTV